MEVQGGRERGKEGKGTEPEGGREGGGSERKEGKGGRGYAICGRKKDR